ncbi:septum formation inhibitor Maf [Candidatus Poribacteria bacterium]|nr:MAG: septum formation inhibitor Maf [Candidatus Poribacteria bacterium]
MAHSELFHTLPRFVLASASPRRAALLSQLGLTFEICPSDVEEPLLSGTAAEVTQKLALLKAETVARQYTDGIIIGADTLVSLDGELLGKPTDDADAREMLMQLSGTCHEVVTGVALIVADSSGRCGLQEARLQSAPTRQENEPEPTGQENEPGRCGLQPPTVAREIIWTETTNVYFRELRIAEIADYIASGEASDKAGAYGIQSRGAAFVKRIEGCYFNVVGLPLASLIEQFWTLQSDAER